MNKRSSKAKNELDKLSDLAQHFARTLNEEYFRQAEIDEKKIDKTEYYNLRTAMIDVLEKLSFGYEKVSSNASRADNTN